MKWNKSRYRKKSDILVFKYSCMFLLLAIVISMSISTSNRIYMSYYAGFCCISLIYFAVRTKYINKQIKKYKLVLTEYSCRILKIHKLIIIIYICITAIIIIVCIFLFISDKSMEIWIWYASVLPMLYSDSVYLSGLTAFGDEKYLSGEYLLDYSEIAEIKMLNEKNTSHGKMILCSIYSNNKEIGYDKLFIDEYHRLRLKVYQDERQLL